MRSLIGFAMLLVLWAIMCASYAYNESYGPLLIWIFLPPIGWLINFALMSILLFTSFSIVQLVIWFGWVAYPILAFSLIATED
jgi:hypothetical protein